MINVKDNEIEAPRSKKAGEDQPLDVRPRGGSDRETEALLEKPAKSTKVDPDSRVIFLSICLYSGSCALHSLFSSSLSLKLILKSLRRDKLILGKEESESHCRMEPGFVRPRAAVTTSGNSKENLNSSDIHILTTLGKMRFVLNDVSVDLMDGKIFQTVQTGICEAKGFDAPCGGGGKSA